MTTTVTYVLRQPKDWPSTVVSGTPTMLATVRPVIVIATARARRSGGTSDEATTAAKPKYAPCGRPLRNRATTSIPKVGASAESRLAAPIAVIIASSRPLRGSRAPSTANSGAPTTTPTAYAVMALPAVGIETSRSLAMSGRTPMLANSVVPMPKPPSASASTLSQTGTSRPRTPLRAGTSGGAEGAGTCGGATLVVTATPRRQARRVGGRTSRRPARAPASLLFKPVTGEDIPVTAARTLV